MGTIFSYDLLTGDSGQWDDLPLYIKLCEANPETYPTEIQIWSGAYMDKMQVGYGGYKMPTHGDSEPGYYTKMTFGANEYITQIKVVYFTANNYSDMILRLVLTSSKGRSQAYNSWADYSDYNYKVAEFKLPEHCGVVAFGGFVKGWCFGSPFCVSGLTVHYKKTGK